MGRTRLRCECELPLFVVGVAPESPRVGAAGPVLAGVAAARYTGMPPRASPITVNVRITHTVNVQLGKASRGYFSDTPYVVTKYVIEVRWITEKKRSESKGIGDCRLSLTQ